MRYSNSHTGSPAASVFKMHCGPVQPENIVDDEPEWRVLRQTSATALSASRVIATRWHAGSGESLEVGADTSADCHVVKIVLRTMNIRFWASGRIVQDGVTTPGTVHVTEPAAPVRCLFRGPYDVLHLHVPNTLIAECARHMPAIRRRCFARSPFRAKDMAIDSLGALCSKPTRVGGSVGQLYADCISIAIVARLLGSASDVGTFGAIEGGKLAHWRLKRAIDYVEGPAR